MNPGHFQVNNTLLIDISLLRVGMFIQLDVGWINHPFPVSSFRVVSPAQIETLRSLGLTSVRYVPAKSDPLPIDPQAEAERDDLTEAMPADPPAQERVETPERQHMLAQQRSLAYCDQRFSSATERYRDLAQATPHNVVQARLLSETLVSDCVNELLQNGESVIRLLSEGVGERSALHPVNVMVLCLLLGKARGMAATDLQEMGLAALLHDLGKLRLPAYLAQPDAAWSAADRVRFESHVGGSVALAQRMELSNPVLTAIAQHHEMADGSGFPRHLRGDELSPAGRILALVNHYDGLCNPVGSAEALTPHEALSVLFAQLKARFDPVVLGAFIRMMGVYPPGSIVQLVNDHYALVVSVNSSRPLRPKVIVYDPGVPKELAIVLDLESVPGLGIRRSLKPAQLPSAALDYLSPRQRTSYYFERAVDPGLPEAES